MKSTFRNYWSFIIPTAILLITVAALSYISMKQHEGRFIYALDDPYIHMAMAKNFSQHGVWGVTRYEFSSSSSSLLWTLLLSGVYLIFGVNEIAPFVLTVTIAVVMLLSLFLLLKKYALPPFYILLVLLGIIIFTPFPALIFTGQEHILHAFLTILFVYVSAKALSPNTHLDRSVSYAGSPLILASFVTLTRYEGLFVVFVVCVLCLFRKRWLYSLLLVAFAVIPIGIYGIISVAHGWFWLPNSVLLKGHFPDLVSLAGMKEYFDISIQQLLGAPHILSLMIGSIIIFILRFKKGIWEDRQIMMMIFIVTCIFHMQFAKTGWFYRYEAYLVALGVFVVSIPLFEYISWTVQKRNTDKLFIIKFSVIVMLGLVALLPLARRGIGSTIRVPRATTNIFEQQYQMGTFLQRYYQGAAVAANDIGAINYLADIQCLDLYGLGNADIVLKKRNGQYNREQIDSVTRLRNIRIAILYDDWFRRDRVSILPSRWVMVGQWKISKNIVCGGEIVSFYAVAPSEVHNLYENLKAFSFQLPKNVYQMGEYNQ